MSPLLMGRDNGLREHPGPALSGCGPFCSCDSVMTLQNRSKQPVGLQLCGILAEALPVLRSELGKDAVIAGEALGLRGRAGVERASERAGLFLQTALAWK